jgi:hypothetical protein
VSKLPPPRALQDLVEALQTSTPRLQAANAKQAKVLALLREVENNNWAQP